MKTVEGRVDIASGNGASRWLVLTRVSTGWLMLPTNTILAEACIASRPRAKEPDAMKSFMICTPSLLAFEGDAGNFIERHYIPQAHQPHRTPNVVEQIGTVVSRRKSKCCWG